MNAIRSVQTTTNTGRYNLASNDESWCLELRVFFEDGPFLARSETFEIDDHPELGWGDDPEDVLDALDERMESYWISTGREKNREESERLREMMPEIRLKWITDKIEALKKRLVEYEEIRDDVEDAPEIFDGVRADLAALTSVSEGQNSE